MARIIIKPQVMEFLAKSPGADHYVGDLANGFKVSETKIQDCINNIIVSGSMPGLEVKIRGRCWVYRPGKTVEKVPASKRVFEELAETKGGDLIIQDQDGRLYRAKELE